MVPLDRGLIREVGLLESEPIKAGSYLEGVLQERGLIREGSY